VSKPQGKAGRSIAKPHGWWEREKCLKIPMKTELSKVLSVFDMFVTK